MGRLLLGLLLLAGAAIVAGDVAGHWTARDALSTGWPVVIVAVGVAQLVFQPRPWLVTALVVGMGGLLLLQQVEAMPIGALWGSRSSSWSAMGPGC